MKHYDSFEDFKKENIKRYELMIQDATQRSGRNFPKFADGKVATVEELTKKGFEQYLLVLKNIGNSKK